MDASDPKLHSGGSFYLSENETEDMEPRAIHIGDLLPVYKAIRLIKPADKQQSATRVYIIPAGVDVGVLLLGESRYLADFHKRPDGIISRVSLLNNSCECTHDDSFREIEVNCLAIFASSEAMHVIMKDRAKIISVPLVGVDAVSVAKTLSELLTIYRENLHRFNVLDLSLTYFLDEIFIHLPPTVDKFKPSHLDLSSLCFNSLTEVYYIIGEITEAGSFERKCQLWEEESDELVKHIVVSTQKRNSVFDYKMSDLIRAHRGAAEH